jgi:hypothetical protein
MLDADENELKLSDVVDRAILGVVRRHFNAYSTGVDPDLCARRVVSWAKETTKSERL